MKRLAWFTLLILATLTLALIFWEFRGAVVLFGLSLAVAAAVRPLVDRLATRGVPRGLALLVAYVLCLGGLLALVLILSGPLLTDLQQLTRDLAHSYEQLKTQWPTGSPVEQMVVSQLPAAGDLSTLGPRPGARDHALVDEAAGGIRGCGVPPCWRSWWPPAGATHPSGSGS